MKPRREEGWYAVRCRTQTELAAREALRRRGIEAIVPTEMRWRRSLHHGPRGGKVRMIERSVMPGYVLLPARRAGEAWAVVHAHPLLRSVVNNLPIPDADLKRLSAIMGREVVRLDSICTLSIGQEVRVQERGKSWIGVLRGRIGEMARVGMKAFNGEVVVSVPLAHLAAA